GRGGFTRCRLRYHYAEPGLLLVANEADGQESLVELDSVARQMAAGHAWVIRSAPSAGTAGTQETDPSDGAKQSWPTPPSGRRRSWAQAPPPAMRGAPPDTCPAHRWRSSTRCPATCSAS